MFSFFTFVPFLYCLHSQVLGCVVFVHFHNYLYGKLYPRVVKNIFIGCASNGKRYHGYHLPIRKSFTSTNVISEETKSVYMHPLLQGKCSFEVKSFESIVIFCFFHVGTVFILILPLVLLILLLTHIVWMSLKFLLRRVYIFPSQPQLQKLVVHKFLQYTISEKTKAT